MSARAGGVLRAASTAPAAAVLAYLAGCWPLLALGGYRPWSAALVGLPLALAAGVLVARASVRRAVELDPRAVAGVLLGALVFAALATAYASENVVLRRDPGSYALLSSWVADHGSREVPVGWEAFGGRDPALTAPSPAYYAGGDELVPQFLSGAPMAFAAGRWVAGLDGLLVVPGLLGALGVLAFGGLVARLLGGWAAVLGTWTLTLTYPVLHASRSTYSEPLALLLLAGGLALLVDAGWSGRDSRRLALAAGLVLGGATLVRVEALREVALVLPVAAVLVAQRRREGWWLGLGLGLGVALGAADGLTHAGPYLEEIRDSIVPLAAGTALVAVAGFAVAAGWAWRGVRLPASWVTRLGPLAAGGVLLVALALAVRPALSLGRQPADSLGARAVRGMQAGQDLALDGTRTYAEQTPQWVAWWLGWPTVLLAVAGCALLAWRALAVSDSWLPGRRLPAAAPVVFVLFSSAVLVLLRPGITPDHPWADRRLVPAVLPLVVLGAVAAVRALGSWRSGSLLRTRLLVAAGVLAVLVPTVTAVASLVGHATEQGEPAAVEAVCDRLEPGDVALLLDGRARREWSQPLRGLCDVPAVGVLDRTALPRLVERARAAGSRPVLVAASYPDRIAAAGVAAEKVVELRTTEDQRLLARRPSRTERLSVDLWIGFPGSDR